MTLCVGLWGESKQFHVVLSDALITTQDTDAPVRLPSFPTPVQYVGNRAIAGMCQKVAIVNDWLLIAFAGRMAHGHELVRRVTEAEPTFLRSHVAAAKFVGEQEDVTGHPNNILLSTCEEGRYGFATWGGIFSFVAHPFSRVVCLGSGSEQFKDALEDDYTEEETSEGLQLAIDAAAFMGWSTVLQQETGFGLDKGWGGAFEIAVREPNRFRKIDDILTRNFTVNITESSKDLLIDEPFTFQFYDDGDLIIVQGGSGESNAYRVKQLGQSDDTKREISFIGERMPSVVINIVTINWMLDGIKTSRIITNVQIDDGKIIEGALDDPIRDRVRWNAEGFAVFNHDETLIKIAKALSPYIEGGDPDNKSIVSIE